MRPVCALPDCDRPRKARLLCMSHYMLWRKDAPHSRWGLSGDETRLRPHWEAWMAAHGVETATLR